MARFDVYPNPDNSERAAIPFMLDLQSNYLEGLETRVVVPLIAGNRMGKRARNLNPEFQVAGKPVVMDTASIGAIPTGELRRPVANLADRQLEIQDALDALFAGF